MTPVPMAKDGFASDPRIQEQRIQNLMRAIRQAHDNEVEHNRPGLYQKMEETSDGIALTIDVVRGPIIQERIREIMSAHGMQEKELFRSQPRTRTDDLRPQADGIRARRNEALVKGSTLVAKLENLIQKKPEFTPGTPLAMMEAEQAKVEKALLEEARAMIAELEAQKSE